MSGQLFIVATPIGNLGDITFRAVETFKSVDLIASEDTRRTENLLRYLGIQKPLVRYDEHTHAPSSRRLIEQLLNGKSIALVTDAGTPGISDPGARLVQDVVKAGVKVVPIPGPSALAAAISASGMGGDGFIFLGFLPRRPGKAKRILQEALGLGKTVAVFESPFRLIKTLELIDQLSPQAQVVLARELTKLHEEFIRGDAKNVQNQLRTRPEKGEALILIEGGSSQESEPESE